MVISKLFNHFPTLLSVIEGKPAAFIYAHIDCAEFFRPREPDCVYQFKPSTCCSSGKVCGDDKKKLATCIIGGKSFREGERMLIPDKPCQTCICSAGFDLTKTGKNANCYESRCSFEIHDVDQLYGGGAPVYKDGSCCPWFWRLRKFSAMYRDRRYINCIPSHLQQRKLTK